MKTEKLELAHLVAYLPYGLKMINEKSGRIIDVNGLTANVSTFVIHTTIKSVGNSFVNEDYQFDLWPFKPLLRPLSAFTDEQWTGLFLKCMDYKVSENHRIYRNGNYVILYYGELNDMTEMPSISKTICSYTFSEQMFSGTGFRRFNQIIGFNELYRFHSDIFGLIESGLALPLTIQNK